jgi:hypothetical protein
MFKGALKVLGYIILVGGAPKTTVKTPIAQPVYWPEREPASPPLGCTIASARVLLLQSVLASQLCRLIAKN